jgi:hypothetical protein
LVLFCSAGKGQTGALGVALELLEPVADVVACARAAQGARRCGVVFEQGKQGTSRRLAGLMRERIKETRERCDGAAQ